MSFLTPLYLFGIIVVGLPILLHLVRHQPKNIILFSSLRFLEHKPPQTNRKNKIENWLLLLLRAAAVMLIIAAFARPFFKNTDLELTAASTTQQTIILIDTSSSMQRGTLWKEAIQKAVELIQQAKQNQIAIYTFDSRLKAVKALKETNSSIQHQSPIHDQELLTKLAPGWNPTNLGQALTEIASLLQQQVASDPNGNLLQNSTIELITDFQAGSQINSLTEFSWPEELQVHLHQLKTKDSSNAGLELLSLDEQSQATVRVVNAADSEQEHFSVAYQRTPGDPLQAKPVYVPRGQSRVVHMPALDIPQPLTQIILSGGEHEFDNKIYLQPREKTNLTIVHYGIPAAGATENPDYFVKRAFPKTKTRDVEFLTVGPDSPQILMAVTRIHLLIISRELSSDEIELVQNYLQQGGVVLFSLNDEISRQTLKPILTKQKEVSQKVIVDSIDINGYALLTNIQYDHPVFQMFQTPEYSDFTKLKFWNYQRLALPAEIPHQVLARFDHENPAIVNFPVGKGKLIVMTFGWTPAESQFALSTKFVPILDAILTLNSNLIDVPSQFTVGERIPFPEAFKAINIRPINQDQIQLTAGQQTINETIQPGIYQTTSENENRPIQKFAVNLAIEESNTTPLTIETLESLGVRMQQPGKSMPTSQPASEIRRQALIRELEQKQKIWRWLIIVALAMLGLETVQSKWISGTTSAIRKA
ncbi:BatA domain-containing protein [uncultured Gimesia sp.]|uniref:BatA domain-containing protein n=1 Tax=uncultured Gimesia sp. TaxID=1678688 RepID=UPI00260C186D|nr:BatA domain-containing protein [uncultured Gimesia sp.]